MENKHMHTTMYYCTPAFERDQIKQSRYLLQTLQNIHITTEHIIPAWEVRVEHIFD